MEKKNNTQESTRASRIAARQQKKRAVVSYANMSPELANAFKEKYPKGYADYMGDIFKVDKPDGTFFYAISLEIPEAIYLIKIDVKIDDYEDVENGIFGDADVDADGGTDGDTFPDNDGGNFAAEDDSDE
ncbi:MAG: hypothetical protein IJB58_07450 [Bacteroidales bacterium]|jgi:hypothetical protein|nr:hypothetical protein [Bacteroidales bacterium]